MKKLGGLIILSFLEKATTKKIYNSKNWNNIWFKELRRSILE